MSKVKYSWNRHMSADADIVGAALEAIEEKHSQITPDLVVDEARSGDSVLHPFFTWDDSQAASLHRQTEARYLLRNLRITYIKSENTDEPRILRIPAFPNVVIQDDENEEPNERRLYMSARTAYNNPQARAYIIKRAADELASWRNRYINIVEFADVMESIEETLRRLTNEIKLAA